MARRAFTVNWLKDKTGPGGTCQIFRDGSYDKSLKNLNSLINKGRKVWAKLNPGTYFPDNCRVTIMDGDTKKGFQCIVFHSPVCGEIDVTPNGFHWPYL
jgi:hypothetical protein